MPATSRMHFYVNWAKARLDEMDATLASLESKAGEVQAASRVKAEQQIAELRRQRDAFGQAVKAHAAASEAAWIRTKPELEAGWNKFEADVENYVGTFGHQMQQQQAIFKDVAAAQLTAWRDAAQQLHGAAAQFAVERRTDADAAIKQMQTAASEAEANLQQLGRAGAASWGALRSALAQSRAAFDRANQAASEAFGRIGQGGEPNKAGAEPPR